MLKSAEATSKAAEAKKEQTRMEKYQTYLRLLDKDTSNFSEAKLKSCAIGNLQLDSGFLCAKAKTAV
uniref:Uncharacterized protein n=1 Tax=Oryza meridionalis TaxID=40149 RepID=A0A0E0EM78_9ORYZ